MTSGISDNVNMPNYEIFPTRSDTLPEFLGEAGPTAFSLTSDAASNKRKPTCKIRRMYFAAFSALLMGSSMGFAAGYTGPAIFDMTSRPDSIVKPNDDESTWIGSIMTLGIMIGSIFAGQVGDRFGRKEALVFDVLPFASGWLIIACARNVTMVLIGLFICGLAFGVLNVIVPIYCVEISTTEVRGFLGSAFLGFVWIGNLLSAAIGAIASWEYLALTGALLATVGFLCCLPIPESPRWLISKGHVKRAILVMDYLQGGYVNAEEECMAIHAELEKGVKGNLSFKEFLHPTVYKPIFIGTTLIIFQKCSGIPAVLAYSSMIFETAKSFLDPKDCTVVLSVILMIASFGANFLVDKAGRRKLLLLSALLTTVHLLAVGAFYFVSHTNPDIEKKYSWVPLLALSLFSISFSLGLGVVPHLSATELVPLRARSTAGGISICAGSAAAFIITKSFSESNKHIGMYGTFWAYGCFCILAFFFVFFFVPETKGKKLEDIKKLFDYPENFDKNLLMN